MTLIVSPLVRAASVPISTADVPTAPRPAWNMKAEPASPNLSSDTIPPGYLIPADPRDSNIVDPVRTKYTGKQYSVDFPNQNFLRGNTFAVFGRPKIPTDTIWMNQGPPQDTGFSIERPSPFYPLPDQTIVGQAWSYPHSKQTTRPSNQPTYSFSTAWEGFTNEDGSHEMVRITNGLQQLPNQWFIGGVLIGMILIYWITKKKNLFRF